MLVVRRVAVGHHRRLLPVIAALRPGRRELPAPVERVVATTDELGDVGGVAPVGRAGEPAERTAGVLRRAEVTVELGDVVAELRLVDEPLAVLVPARELVVDELCDFRGRGRSEEKPSEAARCPSPGISSLITSHLYPLGEQKRERCHDGLGPLVEPAGRVARYVHDRLGRRHCSCICGVG